MQSILGRQFGVTARALILLFWIARRTKVHPDRVRGMSLIASVMISGFVPVRDVRLVVSG
jgi:hypothetical protein